ncbi:4a-hydroxytetrahydrobiopterin dehydratase [Variovorax sp. J31P179]|uniref:4a-hydroxytetrahydrobiopterin dehydratase n=1 Tax=Variovorax sp. J31P179 TaxID=3053508 RepID=UPI0025749DA6|nr:4a-hydroxytetrahydrobiopterin dehydratase [Variovorax sp. J31P179]MDM0085058.1 4a-hydroxytetrahydrobiopterin dehydratase [Variovorax sp. J31P179]
MGTPLAFVSYRRADSSAASRWLANSIARTFGDETVFIDTESIRMSDDWALRIENALERATLLIPVIGPHWLSSDHNFGRRRIDDEDDWVHKEIVFAIRQKKRILPVLLSRTPRPPPDALPTPLASLARYQSFELRDERWESDLDTLLNELERFSFNRVPGVKLRYPTPMVSLRELAVEELQERLTKLPNWRIVTSAAPRSSAAARVELVKTFEFASFKDAIGFMNDAVPKINEMQHHPRWENVWRNVTVSLSTWDIGHRPSEIDIELARFLEIHRSKFAEPKGS